MRTSNKRTRRSQAVETPSLAERRWRPLIEEWRQSGLNSSEFCRQKNITPSSFAYWRKEILLREQKRQARRAAARAKTSQAAANFVPVKVVGENGDAAAIEVVLAGGRALRVSGDFDPELLGKLIATLEASR
jgi:hypothetical protein